MRTQAVLFPFLAILLPTTALAHKPKLTIVNVTPQSQTEDCPPQKETGCNVLLGPNSKDVEITWKADEGSEKAEFYVVSEGTCDINKRFEGVPKDSYRNKDTETTFTLKRGDIEKLSLPVTTPDAANKSSFSFKLCFDAGEHPDSTQNATTSAADSKVEFGFGVKYDSTPPKPPRDVRVSGLHKALDVSWTTDEADKGDATGFHIYIDADCHEPWSKKENLDALEKAIQESNYEPERQELLVDRTRQKCAKPSETDFTDRPLEVATPATRADITTFKGNELDNNTVYFVEVVAFDRVGNENPRPDISTVRVGIPIPSIGPRDIFDDKELGCSILPASSRPGSGGLGGYMGIIALIFLKRNWRSG